MATSSAQPGETLHRELWRQALLIAARDEMGLTVFDEGVCGPVDSGLNVHFDVAMTRPREPDLPLTKRFGPIVLRAGELAGQAKPTEVTVGRLVPSYEDPNLRKLIPVYRTPLAVVRGGTRDQRSLLPMLGQTESLSRGWLVKLLKQMGYSPVAAAQSQASATVPGAEMPADLDGLDLWTHLAAVREAHRLLRTHGESPSTLAVLARGYAQLGVLTDYFWSGAPDAFTARGLLYAERLARRHPDSAEAAWTRAYVLCLAGLHQDAILEAQRAAGLPSQDAPPWAKLIKPYCRADTEGLSRVGEATPEVAPWAAMLSFITVHREGSPSLTVAAGERVLKIEPNCFRALDALAGLSYADPNSRYRPVALAALRTTLVSLAALPGLPAEVAGAVAKASGADAQLEAVEEVARSLVEAGDLGKPSGDPYWSEVGWVLRETAFAMAFHEAHYLHETTSLDAKGVEAAGKPLRLLVAEHPYWRVLAMHLARREPLPTSDILSRIPYRDLTPAFFHMGRGDADSVPDELRLWPAATTTAFGRADPERRDEFRPSARLPLDPLPDPRRQMRFHTTREGEPLYTPPSDLAEKPAAWLDIASRYSNSGNYERAREALRKAIALAPDPVPYQRLADTYLAQNNADGFVEALAELAERATAYGSERSLARERAALFLLGRGEPKLALPFAEAAAKAGPQHTRETLALCCEALGRWDEAEALMAQAARDRGGLHAIKYYLWCKRTGRGDAGEALNLATQSLEELRARYEKDWVHLSDADRARWEAMKRPRELELEAVVALLEGRTAEGRDKLRQVAQQDRSPWTTLHAALLADMASGATLRDELFALLNPDVIAPYGASPVPWPAALLWLIQDHTKQPPGSPFDTVSLEVIARDAPLPDRVEMAYLATLYLRQHGEPAQADDWLRRANGPLPVGRLAQTLAAVALRQSQVEAGVAQTQPSPSGTGDTAIDGFTVEVRLAQTTDLHITPWGLYWAKSIDAMNNPAEPAEASVDEEKWVPRWGRPHLIALPEASSGWPLSLGKVQWKIAESLLSAERGGRPQDELGSVKQDNWTGETLVSLTNRTATPVWFKLRFVRDPSLPDAATTSLIRPLASRDVVPRMNAKRNAAIAQARATIPHDLPPGEQTDERLHGLVKSDDAGRVIEFLATTRNLGGLGQSGETALHWARSAEVAALLLDAGAAVDARSTKKQQTPLHWAAFFGRSPEVARLLLDRGADPAAMDFEGRTPLHLAATSKGDNAAAVAKVILGKGADVNAKDRSGATPLTAATNKAVADVLRGAGGTE